MSNSYAAVEAVEAEILKTITAAKQPFNEHVLKSLADGAAACAQARAHLADADERTAMAMAHKVFTVEIVSTLQQFVAVYLKDAKATLETPAETSTSPAAESTPPVSPNTATAAPTDLLDADYRG